jgi:hypothetical protein
MRNLEMVSGQTQDIRRFGISVHVGRTENTSSMSDPALQMTGADLQDDFRGALFDPEVRAKLARIEQVAGFLLPAEHRTTFRRFHQMHIDESYPDHIRALKHDRPRRFQQVLQGILGDVEQSLAAVYYHRGNLARVEAMIYAEIADEAFLARLGRSTVAVGNTAILDFEYHALVLAARRCLDYLARVVGACFAIDISSFRKINAIRRSSPRSLAEAVLRVHQASIPRLGRLVTETGDKSVRDIIAHYSFVDAGALNISQAWSGLFGGPEALNTTFARAPRQHLIEPVNRLCTDVQLTVDQLLCNVLAIPE